MADCFDQILFRFRSRLLFRMPVWGDYLTAIEGLILTRRDGSTSLENCLSGPLVGLVIQGDKETCISHHAFRYGERSCLVSWQDGPQVNRVLTASPDAPCLGLSLSLDTSLARSLLAQTHCPAPGSEAPLARVADVEPGLLDAFFRLVCLLDHPQHIGHLAPMYQREIHYRILIGALGGCAIPREKQRISVLGPAWDSIC